MRKTTLIVFASLVVLIGIFMFSRPPDRYIPSNESSSLPDTIPGAINIKKFSDTKKTISEPKTKTTTAPVQGGTEASETSEPKETPIPLPYPRIMINYSVEDTSSIGNNVLDENSTFVLVKLDIKNFGYKYFDAYPNNFRAPYYDGDLIPLINVSTGNMIDAVIPNNSRAIGDIVFIIPAKANSPRDIKYSPIGNSENYYIMYQEVNSYEIGTDGSYQSSDDEEGVSRRYRRHR